MEQVKNWLKKMIRNLMMERKKIENEQIPLIINFPLDPLFPLLLTSTNDIDCLAPANHLPKVWPGSVASAKFLFDDIRFPTKTIPTFYIDNGFPFPFHQQFSWPL